MKHRMIRILIAVVLICALLVSWSPIRARAMALPEVAAGTAHIIPFAQVWEPAALGLGGQVFGYVLGGIGVVLTGVQLVNAYNDFQEYSGLMDVSVYYYPDGTWSYGVDVGFIDRVRAFAFERGFVLDGSQMVTTVPEGVAFGNYTPRVPCVAYQYSYHSLVNGAYKVTSVGYLISMIPNDPYVTSTTSACTTYITVNGNKHYFKMIANGVKNLTKAQFDEFLANADEYYYLGELGSVDAALRNVFEIYGWTGIRGAENVAIDYVAPLAVPLPEAYPEWHTNSRPVTNPDTNEEVTVLPIPFNPSADPGLEPDVMTQPDIWQGSIADPMPQPDSGTNAPSEDIAKFGVDLTSFFPFCLPFDIYAFFELLAAEPETPHLEFDIELPFMQEPWHVVIDLSAWDSTALLARRLELLAFIIGLCVFTREKFLRS